MGNGEAVVVLPGHPGGGISIAGPFRPRVASIGDFLGKAPNLDNPPLSCDRIDLLDLKGDVSQGCVVQFHAASCSDGDRAPVHGVVDGKDFRAAVADDGEPSQALTAKEGKTLIFTDLG